MKQTQGGDTMVDKNTNLGPGSVYVGRDNSGPINTHATVSNDPNQIEALLKPLIDAIVASNISGARKAAVDAQLGVLREEAAKSPKDRDAGFIRSTLENLKAAVGAAKIASEVWAALSGFFGFAGLAALPPTIPTVTA
jgi:hypothetical protein